MAVATLATVEFRVLGPVEAFDRAALVSLGGRMQRTTLALLVVHANEVVASDRLIEDLWSDAPPQTAPKTLQTYIYRLRKALGAETLVSRGGGYVLLVDAENLDADRFQHGAELGAAALAAGRVEEATEVLRDALGLWRGRPFEDLAYEPCLQTEIRRLEELHLVATENRIEAELRLGLHAELVAELHTLVSQHPMRERLWFLHLLALYRSGRQAEALAAFAAAKQALATELGLEPSPALRQLEQLILDQSPSLDTDAVFGTRVQERAAPGVRRNPYKGLRAFEESDAADFYGRDDLVRRLLERLAEHGVAGRLVALVGPSGSGKSSVVRAGLLPAIRKGEIPGSASWLIAEMYPGTDPFRGLDAALSDIQGATSDLSGGVGATGSTVLVVIDQFEELYTLTERSGSAERFLDLLVSTIKGDAPVRMVLTIRADYLDRPLQHPAFARLLEQGLVVITPLADHETRAVITRPAAAVAVAVEPELVAEASRDVAAHPGALPLLQYAMTDIFDRCRDPVLTLDAYRSAGGILGALSRRASDLYEGFDATEQDAAYRLFLRLVTVTNDDEIVRRRVGRDELEASSADPAVLDAVMIRFGHHRLLTFDRDARTHAPTVEIAHEALLTQWSVLRGWIEQQRETLLLYRRFSDAAAEWQDSGRDPSYLLSGGRLSQFESWAESTPLSLTREERGFLDESRRHTDQQENRRRRRRRVALSALAGVAVVALVLGSIAFVQRDRARTEERRAQAEALAAASTVSLSVDPERSILLALEAVATTQEADGSVLKVAQDALHRAVSESRLLLRVDVTGSDQSAGHAVFGPGDTLIVGGDAVAVIDASSGTELMRLPVDGEVAAVTVSPDGSLVAVGTCSGTVSMREITSGAEVQALAAHVGCVGDLEFSADGTTLVSASMDGSFGVWDVATGTGEVHGSFDWGVTAIALDPNGRYLAVTPAWAPPVVWDLATDAVVTELPWSGLRNAGVVYLGDSGRLVTAAGDGTFTVWDAETGSEILTQRAHPTLISWIDVSTDGSRVVTGGADGLVKVWLLGDRSAESHVVLAGHQTLIGSVAFEPAGGRVASVGGDGTARVWDVTPLGGREIRTWPGPGDVAGAVAFRPDGGAVASSVAGGEVVVWDVPTGLPLVTLPAHGWAAMTVAFSPDGRWVATGGADGVAAVREAATGEARHLLDHHPSQQSSTELWVTSVAFSTDGRLLATAGYDLGADGWQDGVVRIWDLSSGKIVREFSADQMLGFYAAEFNPAGGQVAAFHGAGEVWAWDLDGDTAPLKLNHAAAPFVFPGDVPFSPDGTRLVLFEGSSARIVAASDDAEATTLEGHAAAVNAAAFHPDGGTVATAAEDGTVRVWDVVSGTELVRLVHEAAATDVAFGPNGRRLVSIGQDGVRLWTLALDELIDIAESRLTRGFTDGECRTYLDADECRTGE